ncbi:MAG: DUF2846 domain-containing protein [Nitrospiraceae bacterium]|nr:DUF2846 domain-containing protein [Nitrospiraceae bacterium]
MNPSLFRVLGITSLILMALVMTVSPDVFAEVGGGRSGGYRGGCHTCASGMKFAEMNPSTMPKDQDSGRIFFYRTSVLGAALRPDINLNGTKIGDAIAQGFFYVDRPPGNYEVVTSTEVDRKVTFVLENGQTRFVKFSVSSGLFVGHVYGELVDSAVGMEEIKECKYTGADAVPK